MKLLFWTFKVWISSIVNVFDYIFDYKEPRLLDIDEALSRRALIRWGDGETTLAVGWKTKFQSRDARLAKELRRILVIESHDIAMCFPPDLCRKRPFIGANLKFRRLWSMTALLLRLYSNQRVFGNAFLFRMETGGEGTKYLLRELNKLKKDVLIVSSCPSHVGLLDSQTGIVGSGGSIQHIKVDEVNAYASKQSISEQLKAIKVPDIALFSAGPVGKCLIVELMSLWPNHTRLIDTGNFFNHFEDVMATK